jgi:hypothetical protein
MCHFSEFRLFNRPTDQIWTSNLIGRFVSEHQSNLSDWNLDNLDYLVSLYAKCEVSNLYNIWAKIARCIKCIKVYECLKGENRI